MKKIIIVIGIIVSMIILSMVMVVGANNKAIVFEEQIKESSSGIQVQEKRRVDLIVNLVDSVENYNAYEQETMKSIINARNSAENGNVEEAERVISVVVEKYPELKSNENYKVLMNEMSVTENLIANYRNNYNIQVKNYNKHIRKFPNNLFLSIMGYEKITDEYLNYETSEDSPKNLFNK